MKLRALCSNFWNKILLAIAGIKTNSKELNNSKIKSKRRKKQTPEDYMIDKEGYP